jgi:hypothetical protein
MAEPTEQMEGLNVGEGGELSKAQLKKLEAKRLKEAQKAEKAAAREAAEQARVSAAEDDPLKHLYGDLPLVQSQEQTGRVRTPSSHTAVPIQLDPGSQHPRRRLPRGEDAGVVAANRIVGYIYRCMP